MVRFKNRWILLELLHPSSVGAAPARELTGSSVFAALRESVLAHFGDVGWGAVGASLSVKYFSPVTGLCIVRVGREPHRIAWAAAALLTSVDGRAVIPNVVHVSGTIKHAQLAAVEHNRAAIARFRAKAKTPVGYQDSYAHFLEESSREIGALRD